MPYINQDDRDSIMAEDKVARTAGELNYRITMQLIDYLNLHGESYQTYNDIIGALEGAKLELYRRKIAPYEDKKIKENGDVY